MAETLQQYIERKKKEKALEVVRNNPAAFGAATPGQVAKTIGGLAKNVFQGTMQSGAIVAGTALDTVANAFLKTVEKTTGKPQKRIQTTFQPQSTVEKIIFGDKPFSAKTVGTDIITAFNPEASDSKFAAPLGLGLAALDVPTRGVASKLLKLTSRLSKTNDEIKILKTLEKEASFLPEAQRTRIAQTVKDISDPNTVRQILTKETSEFVTAERQFLTTARGAEDVTKEADEVLAKRISKLEEAQKGAPDSLFETARKLKDSAYRNFVDETLDIYKNIPDKQLAKRLQDQVDTIIRSNQNAELVARDIGLVDVVQSKAIFNPEDYSKFNQYLIARHNKYLDAFGVEKGLNVAEDDLILQAYREQFEGLAQKVDEVNNRILNIMVDSGEVSQQFADYLKAKYPNYVPMNVVFGPDEKAMKQFRREGGIGSLPSSPIQKIKGSERAIENPLESIYKKLQVAVRRAEINTMGKMVANLKDIPGNPLNIRVIDDAENILERMKLLKTVKEAKSIRIEIGKNVAKYKKELLALQRELKALSKEGTTQVKRAGRMAAKQEEQARKTFVKDFNKIKTWNDLPQVFVDGKDITSFLKRDFGQHSLSEMIHMIKEGGYSSLIDVYGLPENAAKAFAKTVVDAPVYKTMTEFPSDIRNIIEAQTPEEIMDYLVASDSAYATKLIDTLTKKVTKSKTFLNDVERKYIERVTEKDAEMFNLASEVSKLKQEFDAQVTRGSKAYQKFKELVPETSIGKDEGIFYTFTDGVKESYAAPIEMVQALKNMNKVQMSAVVKAFSMPNRLRRLGTTGINVLFSAINLIRDPIQSAVFTDAKVWNSAANPILLIQTMAQMAKKGDLWDDFVRSGASGTMVEAFRGGPTLKSIEKIRASKNWKSAVGYTIKTPSEYLSTIEDIVSLPETLVRFGNFNGYRRELLAKGYSKAEANRLAARNARDTTVNFMRRGRYGHELNALQLYLNASIQGTDIALRKLKNNPVKIGGRLAVLGVPVVMLTANNLSEKNKDLYDRIAQSDKDLHLIYIPPTAYFDEEKNKVMGVIKVPMPPGLIMGYTNIVRTVTEQLMDYDRQGMSDVLRYFSMGVSPIEFDPDIGRMFGTRVAASPIGPLVESASNRSFFFDREIENDSLMRLPVTARSDYTTSPVFEGLSKVGTSIFGEQDVLSPKRLQYVATQYGGGLGRTLINAADNLLATFGVIDKEDVSSTGPVQYLKSRLFEAYGGEEERRRYAEFDKLDKEEELKKKQAKDEAKDLIKQIKEAPTNEEKKQIFNNLNAQQIEAIKNQLDKDEFDYSSSEWKLKNLDVKTGMRAKAIVAEMEKMDADERGEYIKNLVEKKIVTNDVAKQIILLSKDIE